MTDQKNRLKTSRASRPAGILLLLSATALPLPVCAQTNVPAEEEYRQAMQILKNPRVEGIPLYQENRTAEAVSLLKSAAAQGDADGLFLMGKCHEAGAGVACYLPKALGFYLLAAAHGNQAASQRIEPCRQQMTEHQMQTAKTFAHDYAKEHGLSRLN